MAGGMGVTKNKFIEDWATRRENAEQYFKYTRLNWARLAVFGFALPMAVYHLISSEMVCILCQLPEHNNSDQVAMHVF